MFSCRNFRAFGVESERLKCREPFGKRPSVNSPIWSSDRWIKTLSPYCPEVSEGAMS